MAWMMHTTNCWRLLPITKPFILVSIQRQTKTSRGKEKYLQFFFLKTLSLIILSFNFLSTQKILAIYACLKKKKHFCICIKKIVWKFPPVFNEKIRQKPTTYYDTEDKRQKMRIKITLKFEIVCDETKIRVRCTTRKKKDERKKLKSIPFSLLMIFLAFFHLLVKTNFLFKTLLEKTK